MKKQIHVAALILLGALAPVSQIFGQVVGTYYADWSLSPVSHGPTRIAPGEFTALAGLNLVVEFGDGNVITSPPYFAVVGGGADSTRYRYSDVYNPDGRWIPWQDSLSRSVHRNGGKVVITIQAVNPSALKTIQADSATTETFCYNAAQYAKRRGLDGLEVDEEYWQVGPPPNDQLARFYRILRRRVDEAFLPARGLIILTTGRGYLSTYNQVNKSDVDYVYFMLYDYQWVWNTSMSAGVSYYFSPLNTPSGGTNTNATSIISDGPARWATAGWPKQKLVFGIPAYGFVFRGTDALWQNYGAQSNVSELIMSAMPNALSSGGVQGWDGVAQVPYIAGTATKAFSLRTTSGGSFSISAGQKFFISYENAQSLQSKWDYIKNGGFGGMFLYDVGGDVDASRPGGTYTPLHTAMVAITSGSTIPTAPTGTLGVTPPSLPAGGGNVTLTWSSANAVSASIDHGIGAVGLSGSTSVSVTATTSFTLTLSNNAGTQSTYSATVTVAPANPNAPTGTFIATPTTLPAGGDSVTLQWTSSNADTARIDNGIGIVSRPNGSLKRMVTANTTFRLTLANSVGLIAMSATVTLVPSGVFSVNPTTLPAAGGDVTLTWSSVNASSATINQGIGSVGLTGTRSVHVTATTTFGLTLTSAAGTQSYNATATVVPVNPNAPTGTFIATPTTLPAGGDSVTLQWTSSNADTARIDNGIGIVSRPNGSLKRLVTASTTFRLTLANSVGPIAMSATVTVDPPAQRPKDFALEQNYPNPFNPSTKIIYKVPADGIVRLKIFSLLGEELRTIVDGYLPAGTYSFDFSSANLSSGVYYYSMFAGNFVETRKMVILK